MAGTLLLAEAVVTVVWQEPITTLQARAEQAALEGELAEIEAAAPKQGDRSRSRLTKLADLAAKRTDTGQPLGRIEIPAIGASYVFVDGTDDGSLQKGPGHYIGTPLPGQPGTVGMAGHRTTYDAPFASIDDLEKGDLINVTMPYGQFRYRVARSLIVDPSNVRVLNGRVRPRLVLTTCHPKYSDAQRYVVDAVLISRKASGTRAGSEPV